MKHDHSCGCIGCVYWRLAHPKEYENCARDGCKEERRIVGGDGSR